YDSFGLAPGLASSGDSGGSGVAAILELARLFSNLYSNPYHKPKYNLLFVLTGADNFNYFGTKYFIEDMLEDADNYLLSEADYTLCLDALAGGSDIFLHVSRPPKEGTKGQELMARMNESLSLVAGLSSVTLNHKKIRIGDDALAWSHERFSLRKVPAGTLSHFSHHSDIRRKSMFHTSTDVDGLSASVQLIAESVVRHILPEINEMDSNYTSGIFTGQMSVHTDSLQSWLDYLSQTGRSQQSLLNKDHPLLLSLQQTLSSYVHEVSTFTHKPDKSDPEFVIYTQSVSIMHSYSVKPAVLDLVLAISILCYMGGVYLLVMYFSNISQLINEVKYRVKAKRD
ncbi:PREDICTED: nicalin-like, partial [Amphimedon queenslandica]|uniref:BOS complex subunit NCLN n=2 Tax=Amphimedon queenslandica TaxID=400682 RepID=A0AAN0IRS7_AMPQE